MKTLLFLTVISFSFLSYSQKWSWEQRMEESIYLTRMNKDYALTTIVSKLNGSFSEVDFYQTELLCLKDNAEAIFRIEVLSNSKLKVYHLSAFNQLNLELLFTSAIGTGNFNIAQSNPYFFP